MGGHFFSGKKVCSNYALPALSLPYFTVALFYLIYFSSTFWLKRGRGGRKVQGGGSKRKQQKETTKNTQSNTKQHKARAKTYFGLGLALGLVFKGEGVGQTALRDGVVKSVQCGLMRAFQICVYLLEIRFRSKVMPKNVFGLGLG
jgi:hypothetical protein